MQGWAALGPRAPSPGERAYGHGIHGVIEAVRADQPLGEQNVWRVTLEGEAFGRLVCPAESGAWHLLQLTELTDAQLEILEADTLADSSF